MVASHPPTPTRQDAPRRGQGRAKCRGKAYRGPVAPLGATGDTYIEPPSDARTQLETIFTILLDIEPREEELPHVAIPLEGQGLPAMVESDIDPSADIQDAMIAR